MSASHNTDAPAAATGGTVVAATVDARDDKIKMLMHALKLVNGTLDFEELARIMEVANAEAMRKRFRRFFEKEGVPLNMKGNCLGTATADNHHGTKKNAASGNGTEEAAKTPTRTPKKRKATADEAVEDTGAVESTEDVQPAKKKKVTPRKAAKEPQKDTTEVKEEGVDAMEEIKRLDGEEVVREDADCNEA